MMPSINTIIISEIGKIRSDNNKESKIPIFELPKLILRHVSFVLVVKYNRRLNVRKGE